jgi:hypothetical protein
MNDVNSRLNIQYCIAVVFVMLVISPGSISTNAFAQSSDNKQSMTKESDSLKEKTPDVICKRQKVLGSHMRVKVCSTREQREEAQRVAEESMRSQRGGINASNGAQ